MDHGPLVLSGEFKYWEKKKKVGKVTPEANKLKINTEHLKKKTGWNLLVKPIGEWKGNLIPAFKNTLFFMNFTPNNN